MKNEVKAVPDWMHTVTPHLVCDGAEKAMEFYKKAFGAVELAKLPTPEGKLMHGSMRIGDSSIMLVDAFPEMGAKDPKALGGTAVTIHLQVQDVDAVYKKAIDAGATAKMPPADMFWGDRYGLLVDPFGHQWSIATHIKDLTKEEIEAGAKAAECV
jgi:uncharacterized glyoxalase superfamily protein PhnB